MSGALTLVQAEGFQQKGGATMKWGTTPDLWSWFFKETNRIFPFSYQVERPRFDQILLDHAASCGVRVHQGSVVDKPQFDDNRLVSVEINGAVRAFDYVIDTTGQAGLLATALNWRDPDEDLMNLAVYGYYSNSTHLDEPADGNILIESIGDGWFWKIPLRNNISSLGVVVDRDLASSELKSTPLDKWFDHKIAQTTHIQAMLRSSNRTTKLSATRDWSYTAKHFTGGNFCLAGDAACFIDPLFSTGVHLAISSAYRAAALITTMIEESSLSQAASIAYESEYRTMYNHFQELVKLFYSGNVNHDSYFWQARKISAEHSYSSRSAFVRLVSGQTVGYERSVLSHAKVPESFTTSVELLQTQRSEIRELLAQHGFTKLVFKLSPDVVVESDVRIASGRYERALIAKRSDGSSTEISRFVKALLVVVRSELSVDQIRVELQRQYEWSETAESALKDSLRLLSLEGVIEVRLSD